MTVGIFDNDTPKNTLHQVIVWSYNNGIMCKCKEMWFGIIHKQPNKLEFYKGYSNHERYIDCLLFAFPNTKNLALEIAKQTGGTLRELIPENNYSFDYNTAAKEVRNQITRGFCPKLIFGNESIDEYRTIFIGTPNWFKTIAPPVLSFLRQHDFADKTVVPFCTHGGGGFGEIENDIAKECSKSRILPGIAVNGAIIPEEVTNWLEAICVL